MIVELTSRPIRGATWILELAFTAMLPSTAALLVPGAEMLG